MTNNQTPSRSCESQSSQVQSSAAYRNLPFPRLMDAVREHIEIECFRDSEIDQAEEIALIIAEVAMLPESALVRIAGDELPAGMVVAIYGRLTHEHVVRVMENYAKATYEIKRPKTYLRTALYNSVFELTSRIENQVNTDMPWLAKK